MQTTDTVVMVPPQYFDYNTETAATNAFQHRSTNSCTEKAMQEFESAVHTLRTEGVRVLVLDSPPETPDAVFPNNWFVTWKDHSSTKLATFPMATPNRRQEVQLEKLLACLKESKIIFHEKDIFRWDNLPPESALEGTGAMVLDRLSQQAYVALSPRANSETLFKFTKQSSYEPVIFRSCDENGKDIYHTNVLLSIGTKFAVICGECICSHEERQMVYQHLRDHGRHIIEITFSQMMNMAANILELRTKDRRTILAMSQKAYCSFTDEQRNQLSCYGKLVPIDLETIETIGGGSMRCMLAEIFY